MRRRATAPDVAVQTVEPKAAMTIHKFAEAFDISSWTVRRMIRLQTLRTIKIGGAVRIPWSEAERLIKEGGAKTGHHVPYQRKSDREESRT